MKKINDEKIVGYAILIAGLCIMVYAIAAVIVVFNGGEIPLKIIQVDTRETIQSYQTNQLPSSNQNIQSYLNQDITSNQTNQLSNLNQSLTPALNQVMAPVLNQVMSPIMKSLSPMLNTGLWIMLAFFIIAAGGKVARIGIRMIKVSVPDDIKTKRSTEDKTKEKQKTT